jgi:5-methylthioadenosine/S-adenosylhomocysteine deaminase
MANSAVELLERETPVMRVRGAVAFTDASRPRAGELRDAAVLVRDGRIVAVGPAGAPATKHPDAVELGGSDYWILPGLVNAHTHGRGIGWFRLGALDDSLEPWIYNLMGQPGLDPYYDTVYQNLRLIESGVTTALHSHYPRDPGNQDELEATIRAYVDTGLRVGFAVSIFTRNFLSYDDVAFLATLPAELRQRVEVMLGPSGPPDSAPVFEEIRRLSSLYQGVGEGASAVRILHGPVAPQWVSPEELQRCYREADELGGGVHMHLLETPYQRAYALCALGESWGVHLDRLGVLGPNVSVAHAVWTEDADMDCFADRGVTVCHNPSSNLRLKSGIAPVARMRGRGVRVALGGDNSILGGEEDFLEEMRLCANLHRQPGFDGAALDGEGVLAMGTIAGATATGFGDSIGKLVPGAAADIVLMRHRRITGPALSNTIPPIEALLHAGAARDVETVIIGGRVRYHGGLHRGFDKDRIEQMLCAESVETTVGHEQTGALFRELLPYRRRFEDPPFREPTHYQYNAVAQQKRPDRP